MNAETNYVIVETETENRRVFFGELEELDPELTQQGVFVINNACLLFATELANLANVAHMGLSWLEHEPCEEEEEDPEETVVIGSYPLRFVAVTDPCTVYGCTDEAAADIKIHIENYIKEYAGASTNE
jgi:hypothetical protein